jgi:hypothetical protein
MVAMCKVFLSPKAGTLSPALAHLISPSYCVWLDVKITGMSNHVLRASAAMGEEAFNAREDEM